VTIAKRPSVGRDIESSRIDLGSVGTEIFFGKSEIRLDTPVKKQPDGQITCDRKMFALTPLRSAGLSASLPRQSSSVSRDQLQSDHAAQNENNAEHPQWRSGVAQHRHSQNRGARRADTGPDRVASLHWQRYMDSLAAMSSHLVD
jgi:hypothetical protein